MKRERYDIVKSADNLHYEFFSEGPNGRIKKQVSFQHMPNLGPNVLNVALGDQDEVTGRYNNPTISNNKDRTKVINTVADAMIDFMDFKPNAILYVEGITVSRTRLFQMAFSSLWFRIELQYEVLGNFGNEWLPFQKGINYERFLVFRKI